jgi:hypothetical protein
LITALCNIYIDSELKFELFKRTFPQIYDVSDNWLINIRGRYREEVFKYIKANFSAVKKNCIFFNDLNDKDWIKSTEKMLKCSRYDYVYIFLEDHFLLKSIGEFKSAIREMISLKIEYFQYSFFNIGLSVGSVEVLYPDNSNYFLAFQFSEKNTKLLQENNSNFYPYSLASVCTKKYFNKILEIENKFLIRVPRILQTIMENVLLFYPRNRKFWFIVNKFVAKIGLRFVIYPPQTPFNLEKSLFDFDLRLTPLHVGLLKEEFFANWDDDNKLSNSSLIKRGLYPSFLKAKNYVNVKVDLDCGRNFILGAGESRSSQYCPDIPRVRSLPMKYISIKKGSLTISGAQESYVLNAGASLWVHANISHTIFGNEDCVYYSYIEFAAN